MDAGTVGAWLAFWLREHVNPGLKPKTVEWYRYLVEHYLIPAIGDITLDNLSADHLIMLQNQLRANLADRTANRIMALLNRALKKALKSRKLFYNPADAIDMPRVPRSKQAALSAEQVAALRTAAAGHRDQRPQNQEAYRNRPGAVSPAAPHRRNPARLRARARLGRLQGRDPRPRSYQRDRRLYPCHARRIARRDSRERS